MTAPHSFDSPQTERSLCVRALLRRFEPIDRLIKAHVAALRKAGQPANQYQGLVISDQEIDEVMSRTPGEKRTGLTAASLPRVHSQDSRIDRLAGSFGLSSFETDCLLICAASEIDPRYEKLFSYLQDDVTKRRPSVDLLLELRCKTLEEKLLRRESFAAESPLIRHSLVCLFEESSKPFPTLLGRYARLDDRIASFLFGGDSLDARLAGIVRQGESQRDLESLTVPAAHKERLGRISAEDRDLVLYLQGPYGSGKESVAEAICQRIGRRMLVADVGRMVAGSESELQNLARLAIREAYLQPAALYFQGFDCLFSEDRARLLKTLLREIGELEGPVFLGGEVDWEPGDELRDSVFVRIELPRPDYSDRLAIWRAFGAASEAATDADLSALATKFRFTPGQIEDAARTAAGLANWRTPGKPAGSAELIEAARLQSNRKLAALARKIKPRYDWDQIVLPADRLLQLREICNYVKYRAIVFDRWGFDARLALGKGLNVLFGGPPGTGKTMAAEIIAGELALDLYKIDLSSVVSKYIGETEKNLSRIFSEAETSNAILFFDEADSLFGKRTEVRDSHDRYANIEVGYLLQRMEEYEGIVILATNFRKNLDEAFVRRMHFMIDFPLPSAAERLRIWETIWPAGTPRGDDLDLAYVSSRFELSGGNVRNIALGAAFLAADNGGVVNMRHLMHAIRREYQKMGKLPRQAEFSRAERLTEARSSGGAQERS